MNTTCSVSIDLNRYHAQQDQMIREEEASAPLVQRTLKSEIQRERELFRDDPVFFLRNACTLAGSSNEAAIEFLYSIAELTLDDNPERMVAFKEALTAHVISEALAAMRQQS